MTGTTATRTAPAAAGTAAQAPALGTAAQAPALGTAAQAPTGAGVAAAVPAAVAVDLGSGCVQLWASQRGVVQAPTGDFFGSAGVLVRRGRITDAPGCLNLLSRLKERYPEPLTDVGVVVACRPVNATEADEYVLRRLVTAAFEPARVMLIDTVRAAAVGAGAAAGALIIADIGAQLTELAVLDRGIVVAARNLDIGTRDIARGAGIGLLVDVVVRNLTILREDPAVRQVAEAALARGMVLVGDGAAHPGLPSRLSVALRMPVHCAASPRTAAVNGAGLAAMAMSRHRGT
ncbi:rod shape-determining protein [Actinoplanes sp. GCM10030250]|uniref:rod shape-determining protein n=1 Tax=Actinoplanes sp. GCM10030250 TaxID=3273376 RepID=UPI003616DA99